MRILRILLMAFVFGAIVVIIAAPGKTATPVSCSRATSDVASRWGETYDWQCQVEDYARRTVIVRSNPNGYYWARYWIAPDGAPRLEQYYVPAS